MRLSTHQCLPPPNRPSGFPTRDLAVSNVPQTEVLPNPHDPSGIGKRLTASSLNSEGVCVLMKVHPFYLLVPKWRWFSSLHSDYLSAQSTLLRALFSGSSPFDLISPTTAEQNGMTKPTRSLQKTRWPTPSSTSTRSTSSTGQQT